MAIDGLLGITKRRPVETGQALCEAGHERVELRVRQRAIDPAIAFGSRCVEIASTEHDLQSPCATGEHGESLHRAAAWYQTDTHLGLAENGALVAGKAHVEPERDLAAHAARAAANQPDGDHGCSCPARTDIDPRRRRRAYGRRACDP